MRCSVLIKSKVITHGTKTRCNTLQRTAAHCNTLQHTSLTAATHFLSSWFTGNVSQYTATHCNTLQHALQRTTSHCNALHRTATHCNALQLTAMHCNTPNYWMNCGKHPALYILRSLHLSLSFSFYPILFSSPSLSLALLAFALCLSPPPNSPPFPSSLSCTKLRRKAQRRIVLICFFVFQRL